MPWASSAPVLVAMADGKVFAAGGVTSQNMINAAIYDPVANSWESVTSLPQIPASFGFILNNGNILIRAASPDDYPGHPATIPPVDEIYDPYTHIWTTTSLPFGERFIWSQLLNGDVLAMGGFICADGNNTGCILSSSELFTDSSSSNIDLSVPLLKQTDPQWENFTYDSAQKWAPLHPTIGDWGCALTSAAMVMKYYHIDKLPDGSDLNPGTLNAWLDEQPDGYIRDGLINWLAISRLTKQAKTLNQNFNYDALEYRRIGTPSASTLLTDLQNNQPDILEEPGHFIVGKGTDGSTFTINDPYYNRANLTQGYNNTFLSLGRYIPSKTNLSYIEIVLPPTLDAALQNSSGQKEGSDGQNNFTDITDADYYTQSGITDPIANATSSAAKFLIVPIPQDGNYSLTFYSKTTQPLDTKIFKYDIDGNVTIDTLKGAINPNVTKTITFSYQQQGNSKADRLCQLFQQHIPNQQISDFLCNLVSSKL